MPPSTPSSTPPSSSPESADPPTNRSSTDSKAALRRRILLARAGRDYAARRADGEALARHLMVLARRVPGRTVAAYLSFGDEPDTGPSIAELVAAGNDVLLPVLLKDGDLDWARYQGPERLHVGRLGLREPAGVRLGPGAIADAELVVVPALAVDHAGHRLGRGGGSYDRALLRVPEGRPVLAAVHDNEVLDEVPAANHDQQVSGALTPSGIVWFS